MNKLCITILASSLLLFTGARAEAQSARARIADTPIRGAANLASVIIATLKEGDPVDVVDLQGDWYRVLVPNEGGKPQAGYVLARLIDIVNADGSLQPIPAPTSLAAPPVAEGPPIAPSIAQVTEWHQRELALKALELERDQAVEREQALRAEIDGSPTDLKAPQRDQPIRRIPSDQTWRQKLLHPQIRKGLWFNAGLGFGSYGCDVCVERLGGGSGGLSIGTTLNDRLLVGGGSTGYRASFDDGSALTIGTLDARLRFYPLRTSGFFLTGGIGLGTIRAGRVGFISQTYNGVGIVAGLGWDIRLRPNLSLTPFWNGIGVSTSAANASVSQLGLSITVH